MRLNSMSSGSKRPSAGSLPRWWDITNSGVAELDLTNVSLEGMGDELGHDQLFARAAAAIAEARRLTEINLEWRDGLEASVRRMHFRAAFFPKTLKFHTPWDFREPQRTSQPFPRRSEGDLAH